MVKNSRSQPIWLNWFVLWSCVWALGLGLLAGTGCLHQVGSGPRASVSSASVVTVLRVHAARPGDCTAGPDTPCKYVDTYEPACTAFALRGRAGGVLLVTAAHCVPHPLDTVVRYYAPDGVGHDQARLVARDSELDLAVLEPASPGALRPLERAPVPPEGERVMAISSVYNQSTLGEIVGELRPGVYETTQTIVYGWSGSPELDARGRVWGLVSKCPVLLGGDRCIAGHAYAVDLGAL